MQHSKAADASSLAVSFGAGGEPVSLAAGGLRPARDLTAEELKAAVCRAVAANDGGEGGQPCSARVQPTLPYLQGGAGEWGAGQAGGQRQLARRATSTRLATAARHPPSWPGLPLTG